MSNFTVYTDKQNEFRWKFTASDGNVIAKSGASFKAKDDCLKSVTMLQKDVVGAAVDPVVAAGKPQVRTVVPAVAVAKK